MNRRLLVVGFALALLLVAAAVDPAAVTGGDELDDDSGVYLAPAGYEILFTSLAMDEDVLARVAAAAGAAAEEVARG